jgi:hypothetical protein
VGSPWPAPFPTRCASDSFLADLLETLQEQQQRDETIESLFRNATGLGDRFRWLKLGSHGGRNASLASRDLLDALARELAEEVLQSDADVVAGEPASHELLSLTLTSLSASVDRDDLRARFDDDRLYVSYLSNFVEFVAPRGDYAFDWAGLTKAEDEGWLRDRLDRVQLSPAEESRAGIALRLAREAAQAGADPGEGEEPGV